MLNSFEMTNYDRILAEARQLLTPEEQERLVMDLASRQENPELEASLARGIADMQAGRVTDFDDFVSELEAEDRNEASDIPVRPVPRILRIPSTL